MDNAPEEQRLAKSTIQRIQSAMDNGAVIGMPEVIRLIKDLSTKSFSITINELADIIEQDVAVTAKVIGSANTVGYNPSGIPVNTVSQSIQVIGFEKVRNLAISLLLAENATTQSSGAEEQREVASFALSSGLLAQSIMEEINRDDPEQAFVCTSLRSYGRMLVTTFLIDEYRQAMDRAEEIGEDAAFREVFGLTPIELSHALLQDAHLPKGILRTIQKLPPSLVDASFVRPDDAILVIADLSVKMCELSMDFTLSVNDFEKKTMTLCSGYKGIMRMDMEDVSHLLGKVVSKYNQFSQTYGVRRNTTGTMQLINARATGDTPPEELNTAHLAVRHKLSPEALHKKKTTAKESSVKDIGLVDPTVDTSQITGAINVLIGQIGAKAPDLNKVHEEIINSFHQGLNLDETAILCCMNPDDFHLIKARGKSIESVRNGLESIEANSRDVFGLALSRKEDLLIEDSNAKNVSRYIPMWLKLNVPVMSIVIMPVMDDSAVLGMLIGIRSKGMPLKLDAKTLQAMRALRIHMATMWRRGNCGRSVK